MVLIVLFSRIIGDPFITQGGYSTIWIIVLYCIGALARKIALFEEWKSIKLVALFIGSTIFMWGVYILTGIDVFYRYVSPTVLLNAVILVVLFSRLNPRKAWIKKVAPLTFGIYLFQQNQVIWESAVKERFVFMGSGNPLVSVICALTGAGAIFVSGLLVEYLRVNIAKKISLSRFCEQIANLIDLLLNRLCVYGERYGIWRT